MLLKGAATLMEIVFIRKISINHACYYHFEKWGSCGRLNIYKWTNGSGRIVGFVTSHSLIKYALSK